MSSKKKKEETATTAIAAALPVVAQTTSLVAKAGSAEMAALTTERPDYIKADSRGFEDVRKEDLLLPRLKLLQALSPEVAQGKAKAGDIVNSLTQENFGPEVLIVPIKQTFSRIYWEAREPGADILCASDDGKIPAARISKPVHTTCDGCPMGAFSKNAKGDTVPPACTEFYNFPVLINGTTPAALAMNRSKIQTAKRLTSQAMLAGKGAPFFAMKFRVRSILKTTEKFNFYVFDIVGAGWATKEEYLAGESLYNSMKDKTVVVHEEQEAEG